MGADGALWFTNEGNNSIGRITTAGVVSNFTDPSISRPTIIAAGPDGGLWFTNQGNNSIGRISTAGVVANHVAAAVVDPVGIAAGPDGALWFTNFGFHHTHFSIGRITVGGGLSTFPSAGPAPNGIVAGSDGDLWVADTARPGNIERFSTSGEETDFSGPQGSINQPRVITAGPDGGIWFGPGPQGTIGNITPSGSVAIYSSPLIVGSPAGITAGPDGAIWFTNGDSIGRITTADSVVVTPDQGDPGSSVTIMGSGFNAGEKVVVKYLTGLATPATVQLCSTTATATGTFSCSGTLPPSASSGTAAVHTIKATGSSSKKTAETTYLLNS